jgi:hypothetical protein
VKEPTRDLARITKALSRDSTVSPERLKIEAALEKAGKKPVTRFDIAKKTGLDPSQVGSMLQAMAGQTAVRAGRNDQKQILWLAPGNVPKKQAPKPTPVVNSAMPKARSGELMGWATQPPARAGAADFLNIQSRGV